MSPSTEFHPAVRPEIARAYRWYERQRLGLGREFLDEVESAIEDNEANPTRFGFAEADIREGLLRRFPFAIYYRLLATGIRILSVFHTARDPAEWQSRT